MPIGSSIWQSAQDLQDAMKERLFRARFTEGRLISDPETLVRLATRGRTR